MDARSDAAALHAYYARGEERERLAQSRGLVEFERTKELLLRRLPDPPSVVADIGGGPGRYSLWLAGRGHRVEHRDLVPLHVEQLRSDAGPARRSIPPSATRALERVPELLGIGPHLLATAIRQEGPVAAV